MKKTTKRLLITSLILFCAGLLLSLGSFLYVKIMGIDPYGVEKIEKKVESKSVSIDEILASSETSSYVLGVAGNKFTKVDLTSFTGKIILKATEEESYIELEKANTANLSLRVEGETLVVTEKDAVGIMGLYLDSKGFHFKGLRHILGPGNSANTKKIITVYVNSSTPLSQVNLKSVIGDIEIDGISTSEITASATIGNISVKNCTISDGKLAVTGFASSVSLENNKIPATTVATKFGSIHAEIPENKNQSLALEVWKGDIKIITESPTDHFKLTLSTNIGKIFRNGENQGKKLSDSSNTASRISISAVWSKIDLSYAKGDDSLYQPDETGSNPENPEDHAQTPQEQPADSNPPA